MRFVSFKRDGKAGLAISEGAELRGYTVDETSYPGGLNDLLLRGDTALRDAYQALRRAPLIREETIDFLPILSAPGKMLCVGLNYRDHSAESGFKQPDYPAVFARFSTSLTAHKSQISRPDVSVALDFEGELAAIIGKRGHRIAHAAALSYVAGYAAFNDASVRDYQHKSGQWTVGKNFDSTGAFGPSFVSADELPPGAAGLKIETRLNGIVVQSANTSEMVFDIAQLIVILSEAMTLEPGDVIVSGTPSGVGHARKPPLYMKAGDVCEVEIEQIGILRNTIADEAEARELRLSVGGFVA